MNKTSQGDIHPLEVEGKKFYAGKKYSRAAAVFSQAAEAYSDEGKFLQAAEMRNNQCVSLILAKKPRQALEAVKGTEDVFAKEGNNLKRGMAIANEATAHKDLGDIQLAVELFTLAASIFEEINQPELHLQTMQSISALKLKTRNIAGALFSMQEGLENIEKPSLRQKILLGLLKIPQNMLER